MEIVHQLVTSRANTSGGGNPCRYITVHETANRNPGADAQAHANLQSRGNVRSASWHYTVDDHSVFQSFPDDVQCWHAGDGGGAGNMQSIGIEICVNDDGDYAKAVANAAWLVGVLMARHGIPASNVVQHNRWSGKNCPTLLRSGERGIGWGDFIAMTGSVAPVSNPTPATKPTAASTSLAVDGLWGVLTTKALQRRLGVTSDGIFGPVTTKALQRLLGVTADGVFGPITKRALQRRLGVAADGIVGPITTKALQRALNAGRL